MKIRVKNYRKFPPGMNLKGKIFTLGLKEAICPFVWFLWAKTRVEGIQNIPPKGGFLAIANHQSFLDFMLLIHAFRKNGFPTFVIARIYYENRLAGFFLRELDQVKNDKKCLEKAKRFLGMGRVLFLFPEGKRNGSRGLDRFFPGVAKIASFMPNLPVVPVGIRGANAVWPPDKAFPGFPAKTIYLKVGKPLFFADFDDLEVFLEASRREIALLCR